MIDENVLRQVIELHDADCSDRTCEPVHFASYYLNGWFLNSKGEWEYYKNGVKTTAEGASE